LAGGATTPAVKEHLRNLAAHFERHAEGVMPKASRRRLLPGNWLCAGGP
jgi:hypothetical protein